jgi:hypothetical protein
MMELCMGGRFLGLKAIDLLGMGRCCRNKDQKQTA